MRRSRFAEDQIIGVLREHEAGVKTAELCRRHGIEVRRITGRAPKPFATWAAEHRDRFL